LQRIIHLIRPQRDSLKNCSIELWQALNCHPRGRRLKSLLEQMLDSRFQLNIFPLPALL